MNRLLYKKKIRILKYTHISEYTHIPKYVYIALEGGINDILSQIERTYYYCLKYNRILLVDTINSTYKINLSDFCYFKNKNIICDINKIIEICSKNISIYPAQFSDKLLNILNGNIKLDYMTNLNKYGYSLHELPNSIIKEDIIIHNSWGGGNGYNFYKELTIKDNILEICKNRHSLLNLKYLCIYIRNTDKKSNYKDLYYENINLINNYECVYIATDDIIALKFFKENINNNNIFNFTTFNININSEIGLHSEKTIDPSIKFIDLLCDIYICKMAPKILSNSYGGFYNLIIQANKFNYTSE